MSSTTSRTGTEIFTAMHRELRRWNPSIPESVDRLDPILKILLELYAHQLEIIDKRIDKTWETAVDSLIKALSPESRRWPVPAHTIIKCHTDDTAVEIDPHTRFFYKEEREGGQTFFFSSHRKVKLISAEVKHIFLRFGDQVSDLSPAGGKATRSTLDSRSARKSHGTAYIAVDYAGMPSNLRKAILYLQGPQTVLRQLKWGYWYPGSNSGSFFEDSGFCPGMSTDVERLLVDGSQKLDWGGLRTSLDLFGQLENNFAQLPEAFTSTWEIGPVDPTLDELLERNSLYTEAQNERYYWIRIDLPEGGDKTRLDSGFNIHFNCFVATNKNELSTYKYTGGNRLVEVEIPEDCNSIFEITEVVDSNRETYRPRHEIHSDRTRPAYSTEERDGRLVLLFDFSARIDPPPDSITVNYAVTAGTAANGIEAGKITELYEKHPGVTAAENIAPTGGAVPARNERQMIAEASLRLRNRDRVVNFQDIASWSRVFDPRIKDAECLNSIERMEKGVRRCILVRVRIDPEDFYSDDETTMLQTRLAGFLKSRSPVNTNYTIEIVRE